MYLTKTTVICIDEKKTFSVLGEKKCSVRK